MYYQCANYLVLIGNLGYCPWRCWVRGVQAEIFKLQKVKEVKEGQYIEAVSFQTIVQAESRGCAAPLHLWRRTTVAPLLRHGRSFVL